MNEIIEGTTNEVIGNKTVAEVLAEEFDRLPYGTLVEHTEIENIIGLSRDSGKYRSTITKARKLLMKNHKLLENIKGQGYRVLEPDDTVDLALSHYKKGFNEIKKGQKVLDSAPINDMSAEGRATYRRVYDRAVILDAATKGAVVEIKELANKKPHPFLTAIKK